MPARARAKRTTPGNALMKCVEDVCGLHGVPFYRMQSRVFTVRGRGGRDRPMITGGWRDRYGEHHTGGMPDFLLTPGVDITLDIDPAQDEHGLLNSVVIPLVPVALWVECKAGRDRLSEGQEAFRDDVLAQGGHWLLVKEGPEALLAWFKKHGVRRR